MQEIRNELCKTFLGRCVWLIVLITVGSWLASVIYSLLVLLVTSIASLIGMITNKGGRAD